MLTPTKHIDTQSPTERPSLQKKVGGKFPTEVCDIEDRCQPRILLAMQMSIFPQSKNSLRACCCFICLLNAIAKPHQREQVTINLAQKLLVLLGCIIRFLNDIASCVGRDRRGLGEDIILFVHYTRVSAIEMSSPFDSS